MSSQVSDQIGVSHPNGEAPTEGTRRELSTRQAETVWALVEATVEELTHVGYDGMTVRNVARRAGVAPATAYTYFGSKDHLVTEAFWRRVVSLPPTRVDNRRSPANRVAEALTDLARLLADEPRFVAACAVAMMGSDPDVRLLRVRVGTEMRRRVLEALGDDADRVDDVVLQAIDLTIAGAFVQVGTGHMHHDELPDLLAGVSSLLLDHL